MLVKDILVIAGEKSGENHFLSFAQQIVDKADTQLKFFGIGGTRMENYGVDLVYRYDNFAAMGYSEVIPKLKFFYGALKKIEQEVDHRNCKTAILIDYQGFNMELAKRLHRKGVKILYYVAPQAWAWKKYRVKKLAAYIDALFCIIPFEKKWFHDHGVQNTFSVKHPLFIEYKEELIQKVPKPIEREVNIVLLPGSRNAEVKYLLPIFLDACQKIGRNRKVRTTLVKVDNVKDKYYDLYSDRVDTIADSESLVDVLKNSDFSFCASGTVTLACALFSVPSIVCYQTSLLNEFIFRNFVNYDGFVSLANIIHQKEVFKELLQGDVCAESLYLYAEKMFCHQEENIITLNKTQSLIAGEDESVITNEMTRIINVS